MKPIKASTQSEKSIDFMSECSNNAKLKGAPEALPRSQNRPRIGGSVGDVLAQVDLRECCEWYMGNP